MVLRLLLAPVMLLTLLMETFSGDGGGGCLPDNLVDATQEIIRFDPDYFMPTIPAPSDETANDQEKGDI